jgi:predicted Zn-dependent protease
MNFKLINLFFFFLVSGNLLVAQVKDSSKIDLNNYTFAQSQGVLPADFVDFYLPENEHNASNPDAKKFIEQNLTSFSNIIATGKIMYNDVFSNYAKKIHDKLFEDDKEEIKKMRIYTIKNSTVNAYTTNDGKIYITMGLWARIENEAQLAFILAHETIHYFKSHAYETYKYNENLRKNGYYNYDYDDVEKNRYRYSKSNEFEADREGALIYFKSAYCDTIMNSVFNLLHYSDYPEENTPVEKCFFETDYFKLRDEVWLEKDSVKPIDVDEDYSDVKITHPNTKSRKDEIMRLSSQSQKTGKGKLFLIDEQEFYKIKYSASIELCEVLYREKRYEECIYKAYQLKIRISANYILDKLITKAYYSLSFRSVNQDSYAQYKKSGYISQVAHVVQFMDKSELIALSINNAWKLYLQNNNDDEIKYILNTQFERTEKKERNYYLNSDGACKAFTFFLKENHKSQLKCVIDSLYKPDFAKEDLYRKTYHTEFIMDNEFASHLSSADKFTFVVIDNNKSTVIIPQLFFVNNKKKELKKYAADYIRELITKTKESEQAKGVEMISVFSLDKSSAQQINDYNQLVTWLDNVNMPQIEQEDNNYKIPENTYMDYIADNFLSDYRKKTRNKYICFSIIYVQKAGVKHKQEYINIIVDMETASVTKLERYRSSSLFKLKLNENKILLTITNLNKK